MTSNSYSRKPELPHVDGGSLPTWVVAREGYHLRITCPREDCQQTALVAASWPRGGYATRPCTYCFKTAKIPPRLRAGRRRPRPVA